jgi:hypothetical protein
MFQRVKVNDAALTNDVITAVGPEGYLTKTKCIRDKSRTNKA